MDIHAIRTENYKTLLNKYIDNQPSRYGSLKKFGEFVGVSARYLTHVNSGGKQLGDDSCRKMEEAHKLPFGWMDKSHVAGAAINTFASDQERVFVEMAIRAYRLAPLRAQASLLILMGELMPTEQSAGHSDATQGIFENAVGQGPMQLERRRHK